MIDQTFQEAIEALYSTYEIFYGSAESQSQTDKNNNVSYHVMVKIVDPERPFTLCDEQGDSGMALFQFATYSGGDPTVTMREAQVLHDIVKDVRGTIGVSPNDYLIDNNITQGVRLIGEGTNSLGVWGVIFTTEIQWHKI
jgi:hypothetical protein